MALSPVVVDSSIWIDHINQGDSELASLLKRNRVGLHPMVFAEVALGSITSRKAVLQELRKLPQIPPAPHSEVLATIEWLELFGKGIGFVDVHLLAATRLVPQATLFTRDKSLRKQAERLEIAYEP
jgi:predicted nucleic acid-binding protein